jgi:hypothetical protein
MERLSELLAILDDMIPLKARATIATATTALGLGASNSAAVNVLLLGGWVAGLVTEIVLKWKARRAAKAEAEAERLRVGTSTEPEQVRP